MQIQDYMTRLESYKFSNSPLSPLQEEEYNTLRCLFGRIEYLEKANRSLYDAVCMKCGFAYSGPEIGRVMIVGMDEDGIAYSVCCACVPFEGCFTPSELGEHMGFFAPDALSPYSDFEKSREWVRGRQSVKKEFRNCECLSCNHKWIEPIRLSIHTANLSGEATIYCPQCGAKSVAASPVEESK